MYFQYLFYLFVNKINNQVNKWKKQYYINIQKLMKIIQIFNIK